MAVIMKIKRNFKWFLKGIIGLFQVAFKINIAEHYEVHIRSLTCLSCHHKKEGVCSICGCTIVFKILLKNQSCPKDFWEAVNDK